MSLLNDGYIILPSLILPDQCAEARKRLDAIRTPTDTIGRGSTTAIVCDIHAKDAWFRNFLSLPRLNVEIGASLDDTNCDLPSPNYIVGSFEARSSGHDVLGLHIDSHMPSSGLRTWSVTAAIAIEDRGVEEGCMYLMPGTHRSDKYPPIGEVAVTPVPLKAGDAVVWDGRIWHGTFPRRSEALGWAILITFNRWWVKPASTESISLR